MPERNNRNAPNAPIYDVNTPLQQNIEKNKTLLKCAISFAAGFALAKLLSSNNRIVVQKKPKSRFFIKFELGVFILYGVGSYVIEKYPDLLDETSIIESSQLYEVRQKNNKLFYLYKSNKFDLALVGQLKDKSIHELDLSNVSNLTVFEISEIVKLNITELKLNGLKKLTDSQINELIKFNGKKLSLTGIESISFEQMKLLMKIKGSLRVNEKIYNQFKNNKL